MKKLDKLILMSFWGPFIVTMSVVVFIFLMKIMIFYIDDFVSKDLGLWDYGRLFFFFSLITVPTALPLAMLLSSLMAFGNLGEFFELTAIKSAGISVVRAMAPLFIVAVGISIFSFYFNDRVSPWANLKGYSLLYDIKTTKATLKIKEGIFYNDLPGYSIKVDKKMADAQSMKGMVIYKHDNRSYERGNTQIILADSGKMYTINENSNLVIELYNGTMYNEETEGNGRAYISPIATGSAGAPPPSSKFTRNVFDHYKLVESLSSFGMKRTDEGQFKYHEFMKNIDDLNHTADSIKTSYDETKKNLLPNSQQYFSYNYKQGTDKTLKSGKWIDSLLAKPVKDSLKTEILTNAKSSASSMQSYVKSNADYLLAKLKDASKYELEKHHKYTNAISCLVMFLIGAPLGAIIKKGGFGVPVLVSVLFFILLYVLINQGDKWVKEGLLSVPVGAWLANTVLFIAGAYFIDRARSDSRLFDKDVYQMRIKRIKSFFVSRFGKSRLINS
ncbi:lipopolysaccharide export system permease protein [Dyadobacter koreensis]|uniref:Lipopolysaccharide export system permease protein n=1 Tax=Dyadobacter koreensis TaxID=408657 RepID=A0A1H6UT25_9BACT|nr:LptF/LptG family permease [Dyadobacter koreensis]SEI94846.1 lipopolysaccharide export system permease protein [Dyadobacter koreensis]